MRACRHRAAVIAIISALCCNVLNCSDHEELHLLYGDCYQLCDSANTNSPQIIPVLATEYVDFAKYTFNLSSTSSIDCIWFASNTDAEAASISMGTVAAQQLFEDRDKVHTLRFGHSGSILCHGHEIHVDNASPVTSNHLCSEDCPSCSRMLTNQRSAATVSLKTESAPSVLVPSLFGISGICIAFVLVCAMAYCFGVRYRRWNAAKSGNETEQIVLDEIAKYTIGDLEDNSEGFYGDYSDRSESASSSESIEELGMGMSMLRVVSIQEIHGNDGPELPNPSLYSSEDEEESDEEQCRADLIVAKKTLCASSSLSGGSQLQSAKSLSTIKEAIVERKIGVVGAGCGGGAHRKHNPLLSGDLSDCKMSSDAAGNSSDLP